MAGIHNSLILRLS